MRGGGGGGGGGVLEHPVCTPLDTALIQAIAIVPTMYAYYTDNS